MKIIARFIGFAIIVFCAAKLGYLQRLESYINGQSAAEVTPARVQIAKEPVASPSPIAKVEPEKAPAPKIPETVYLIEALQLPAGIVPIGAVLEVQYVKEDTYGVLWRGYQFRVRLSSITEDPDVASRRVAESIQRSSESGSSKVASNRPKEVYRSVSQQDIDEMNASIQRQEQSRIYTNRIEELKAEANNYGHGWRHVMRNGQMVPADYDTARKEAIIKEVNYLEKQRAINGGHVGWQRRITPSTGFRKGEPLEEE